jgi:2,6-dihydroxypyridine 3-monooxygenase
MGGLTAALLLRDLGHDVDVYERATGELTGFGAGIVAHPASVRYVAERTATPLDSITVRVSAYRLLDGAGARLWEEPADYRFASWGSLYRALLGAFGRDRYHQGAALAGFVQDPRGVNLRFAGGEARRCDLLVLADGVQSAGRRQLFPGAEPDYSGYVAWRGTIAETDIPAAVRDRIDDTIVYALIPGSHALVYPIPGAEGNVARGRRLWNFVWYRNVPPGAAFDELMTDRDGFPHPISLHPGRVQDRFVRELKDTASASLPADVAAVVTAASQPFIQAIMDVASPAMAVGRVCITGDAAFAVRPHAAAGTAKAAENAWTLAAAIEAAGDDLPGALQKWSAHQPALGRTLLERTRHHGDGSQFRCDWRPGDPAHRFGLYEPGDASDWTR